MSPFPSPDPSASLSPAQVLMFAQHAWYADMAQLFVVIVVTGLGILSFSLGAIAITNAMRRR